MPGRTTATEAWVVLHPGITEGPRAQIAAVTFAFEGPHQVAEAELRRQLRSTAGAPYVEVDAVRDQDGLLAYYRDRGFLSAAVSLERRVATDETAVDLAFTVNEGQQITIGRITVLGDERVSEQQILEELRLVPGQPLGAASLTTARQRLADMGVFRSFSVEAVDRLSGETEGHVVVTVVEAPATTIGFGLGLEGGSRARRAPDGTALEDVVEFVPRGFFEIGRRHLGGRNRAVNLFTRIGLRRSDRENLSETVQEFRFTEYRVTGTFREQHAFRSDTDLLVSLGSEQAVRPTYNYLRHAANAEFLRRLSPRVNVSGRYTLDFTRLFDEKIPEEDQPLIDRLFPQVRLSYISGGVSWDGRDLPLTPTRGTLLSADAALAARAIGSEVGYVKGFFQAVNFRPIGSTPGTVLALRGQLGMARGFPRNLTAVDAAGEVITDILRDLPVSERFFAGGSTTVRGFALDRLGVFDPNCVPCSVVNPTTGLSIGGNAVVILNAELRRALTNINRNLAVVGFPRRRQCVSERSSDLDLSAHPRRRGIRRPLRFAARPASTRLRIQVGPAGRRRAPRKRLGVPSEYRGGLLMRARSIVALCGLCLLMVLAVRAVVSAQTELDRIVARVNNRIITQSDVRQARMLQLVDDTSSDDATRRALENRILILGDLARSSGLPPTTGDDLSAQHRQWEERVGGRGRGTQLLGEAGMSEKGLDAWLSDDLRIRAYLQRQFGALPEADRSRAADDWIARLRQRAGLR